ncbi:hypothetical protein BH23ACT9_BH23ACT9_12300 [soil metagenome]
MRVSGTELGERDALGLSPDDDAVEVRALTDATLFWTVLPGFG